MSEQTENSLPDLTAQQLLDEVSKGHRALKIYERGVQMLQGLVRVEQDIREKTASVAKLTEEEGRLTDVAADAHNKAAEIVSSAKAEANSLIEQAKTKAQDSLSDAKKFADSVVSAAKSEAQTHIEKSIALNGENAALDSALQAKKKELSAVSAALATHKESIKKFVG